MVNGEITIDDKPMIYSGENQPRVCIDIEYNDIHAYTYINKKQSKDIVNHLVKVFDLNLAAKECFDKENNWEESFDNLEDFIENLNTPSNASGALGRVAAQTIVRLNAELDELKLKQK
jgi:hypothetical protein